MQAILDTFRQTIAYLRQRRSWRGAAAVALLALLGDGAEWRGRFGDGVGGPGGHPEEREV